MVSFHDFMTRLTQKLFKEPMRVGLVFHRAMDRDALEDALRTKINELSRSNEFLSGLANLTLSLQTTSDPLIVMNGLGNELNRFELTCFVALYQPGTTELVVHYFSERPELVRVIEKALSIQILGFHLDRDHFSSLYQVFETRQIHFLPDEASGLGVFLGNLPGWILNPLIKASAVRRQESSMVIPLIASEKLIGLIGLWGRQLKQEDVPALGIFANHLATAIQNTWLYTKAQDEIAERTQAEVRIRQALTEKEVLIKEVHHRVKNNLQVISSLLSLQAAEISDPNTLNVLKESQNRVRTMALIHEKLYQSSDLASIDFSTYLQSLVYSLAQSYRVKPDQVSIQVQSEKILLDIDTAIPCGLMVNELVSNSIKYAFPDDRRGQINISCSQRSDKRYCLIVSDDGIGLPPGFDSARASSLGLKLVTSLVNQIDGELLVECKHGARFEINFIPQV